MSKIAKRVLAISEETKIILNAEEIKVQGPKVSLTQKIPFQVEVIQQGNVLLTQTKNSGTSALTGTINSLIFNMLKGVKSDGGYEKKLEVKGVGYKVLLQEKEKKRYLELSLGFSHLVKLDIPTNLEVNCSNNKIVIWGADKQQVGWFAAKIRDFRPPSIYKKDRGIYSEEDKDIKLKAVKTANK